MEILGDISFKMWKTNGKCFLEKGMIFKLMTKFTTLFPEKKKALLLLFLRPCYLFYLIFSVSVIPHIDFIRYVCLSMYFIHTHTLTFIHSRLVVFCCSVWLHLSVNSALDEYCQEALARSRLSGFVQVPGSSILYLTQFRNNWAATPEPLMHSPSPLVYSLLNVKTGSYFSIWFLYGWNICTSKWHAYF